MDFKAFVLNEMGPPMGAPPMGAPPMGAPPMGGDPMGGGMGAPPGGPGDPMMGGGGGGMGGDPMGGGAPPPGGGGPIANNSQPPISMKSKDVWEILGEILDGKTQDKSNTKNPLPPNSPNSVQPQGGNSFLMN